MTREDIGTEIDPRGAEFEPGSGSTTKPRASKNGTLGGIRRTETIADLVEFDSIRGQLPSGWKIGPDLVQFGQEPLAETIRFRRTITDPQLSLKPIDPDDPSGEIAFFERDGPRTGRRQTVTVEPLSEALRVAVNRIHQFDASEE